MPKISVIIPVYNTEQFLKRCLDSLSAQTFSDFEAICVDDGSTDNSLKILRKYALKDKRFHVFFGPNKGTSTARNIGLQKAVGEYIFFLDSDDYLPKQSLEIFLKVAYLSSVDVVVSENMVKFDEKIPFTWFRFCWKLHTEPLKELTRNRKIFSSACNKLYKSEIIKGMRFIEGIYFEDWPFITILFGSVKNYASVSMPLYCYNIGSTSITRSPFSKEKIDSYMKGIRAVNTFYQNRNDQNFAHQRSLCALKMCINKVFRNFKKHPDLSQCLRQKLADLCQDQIIKLSELSLKTRYRLWKMRIIAFDWRTKNWVFKSLKGDGK